MKIQNGTVYGTLTAEEKDNLPVGTELSELDSTLYGPSWRKMAHGRWQLLSDLSLTIDGTNLSYGWVITKLPESTLVGKTIGDLTVTEFDNLPVGTTLENPSNPSSKFNFPPFKKVRTDMWEKMSNGYLIASDKIPRDFIIVDRTPQVGDSISSKDFDNLPIGTEFKYGQVSYKKEANGAFFNDISYTITKVDDL